MTDHANPTPPAVDSEPRGQINRGRSRGFLFLILAVLVAGLTGAIATRAFSEDFELRPVHWRQESFMRGPIDPARAERRADRMVKHLAIEIDATAEQQEKLRAIARTTIKDLVPMVEKFRATRQEVRDLLTAPTIDRTKIEKLRADRMALLDAASKRFTQAVADAGEVLTAEQRRQISERIEERRRGYWHRWHRD